MNARIEDLRAEREATRRAIEHFAPITKAWAFETEPASTQPLLETYLGAVKTCDLLVLIIGQCITEPVKAEHRTAVEYGKPILAFRKDVQARLPEAEDFLKDLDCKWDCFSNAIELREQLRTALGTELLRRLRGDVQDGQRAGDRVARLRHFLKSKTVVRIGPLFPRSQRDLFTIKEVHAQTVYVEKQSISQTLAIPVQRIAEVLEEGSEAAPRIIIGGRLQWLTLKSRWAFLPESAVDQLGVPRYADLFSAGSSLVESIQSSGRVPGICTLDKVPGKIDNNRNEVFYDDDGYYVRHRGLDIDSVLLVTTSGLA